MSQHQKDGRRRGEPDGRKRLRPSLPPPTTNKSKRKSKERKEKQSRKQPPEPPKELVALLRKNPKVLSYFSSLQQNLESDVTIWKSRATEWKKKYHDLLHSSQVNGCATEASKFHSSKTGLQTPDCDIEIDNRKGTHSLSWKNDYGSSTRDNSDRKCSAAILRKEDSNDEQLFNVSASPTEGFHRQKKVPSVISAVNDGEAQPTNSQVEQVDSVNLPQYNEIPINDEMFNMSVSEPSASSSSASSGLSDLSVELVKQHEDPNIDNVKTQSQSVHTSKKCARGLNKQYRGSGRVFNGDEESDNDTADNSSNGNLSPASADRVLSKDRSNKRESISSQKVVGNLDRLRICRRKKLVEAYKCFRALGVSLVASRKDCDEETNDEQQQTQTQIKNEVVINKSQEPSEIALPSLDDIPEQRETLSVASDREEDSFFPINRKPTGVSDIGNFKMLGKLPSAAVKEETSEKQLRRRSDVEVATDIMRSIRVLSRVTASTSWGVYSSGPLLPCFEYRELDCPFSVFGASIDHKKDNYQENSLAKIDQLNSKPSAEGLNLACRALIILDKWSESALCHGNVFGTKASVGCLHDDSEAEVSSMERLAINVGLQNRRSLVNLILTSVDRECSRLWAVWDRSERSTNSSFDSVMDDDSQHSGSESHSMEADADVDGLSPLNNDLSTLATRQGTFQPASSSYNRLSSVVERCMYVHIMSSVYQNRQDIMPLARITVEYIISSTSSNNLVNECEKYAPLLSMCVLETFLRSHSCTQHSKKTPINGHQWQSSDDNQQSLKYVRTNAVSWLDDFLEHLSKLISKSLLSSNPSGDENFDEAPNSNLLGRALSLGIHRTGVFWKKRAQSVDSRIRDRATVELAAYSRISEFDVSWTKHNGMLTDAVNEAQERLLAVFTQRSLPALAKATTGLVLDSTNALRLLLVLLGDKVLVRNVCEGFISDVASLSQSADMHRASILAASIVCCTRAFRDISVVAIQTASAITSGIATQGAGLPNTHYSSDFSEIKDVLSRLATLFSRRFDEDASSAISSHSEKLNWIIGEVLSRCAVLLSDGDFAVHAVELVRKNCFHFRNPAIEESEHKSCNFGLKSIADDSVARAVRFVGNLASIPIVRVINLERRRDRWNNIVLQSMLAQILVVKGPVGLNMMEETSTQEKTNDLEFRRIWGSFAFDGKGTALQFEKRMQALFGSQSDLKKYVSIQWWPSKLRALDKNSRVVKKAAIMDPTERACALSHIASWTGVRNTLELCRSFNYKLSSMNGKATVSRNVKAVSKYTTAALCHWHLLLTLLSQ